MASIYALTDEQRAHIIHEVRNTTKTLDKIRMDHKIWSSDRQEFMQWLISQVGEAWLKSRMSSMYSRSKQGPKNPNYGTVSNRSIWDPVKDGHGYLMELRPDWYTGRKGKKYVFQHTLVMCQFLGLTELPEGAVIHHIDGDITNNDINNLALMSAGGHSKFHAVVRKVQRLSREGVGVKAEAPANRCQVVEAVDDIVHK